MAVAVGPDAQILPIVDGLQPSFKKRPRVLFISETGVLRAEYFREA